MKRLLIATTIILSGIAVLAWRPRPKSGDDVHLAGLWQEQISTGLYYATLPRPVAHMPQYNPFEITREQKKIRARLFQTAQYFRFSLA